MKIIRPDFEENDGRPPEYSTEIVVFSGGHLLFMWTKRKYARRLKRAFMGKEVFNKMCVPYYSRKLIQIGPNCLEETVEWAKGELMVRVGDITAIQIEEEQK